MKGRIAILYGQARVDAKGVPSANARPQRPERSVAK